MCKFMFSTLLVMFSTMTFSQIREISEQKNTDIPDIQISSMVKNLEYKDDKPAIDVLLETSFSKEIRILLKEGQIMKKHRTPYAIVVEIVEGSIDFGVKDEVLHLQKGDIISLKGNIAHDLKATKNSIVRLTLSKHDKVERVQEVVK